MTDFQINGTYRGILPQFYFSKDKTIIFGALLIRVIKRKNENDTSVFDLAATIQTNRRHIQISKYLKI